MLKWDGIQTYSNINEHVCHTQWWLSLDLDMFMNEKKNTV